LNFIAVLPLNFLFAIVFVEVSYFGSIFCCPLLCEQIQSDFVFKIIRHLARFRILEVILLTGR